MASFFRLLFSRPAPESWQISSRTFAYRFYLSAVLLTLVLFSVALDHSLIGIFILSLIDIGFCGDVLIVCGVKDFSNARVTFAGLMTVCIGGGFVYCTCNAFMATPFVAPTHELYVYVLFLLSLSLWAQRSVVRRSERARIFIKKVDDFLPKSGRVVLGKKTKKVFSQELHPGDLILVNPGERIPADGLLEKGTSAIDEELITGNLLPSVKKEGRRVFAGTLNKTAPIYVRVTNSLPKSALMSVIDAIKDGETRRSAVKSPLDQHAWWLLWSIVLLAVLLATYAWGKAPSLGIWKQIGVFLWTLCVGCPAALVFCTVFPVFFLRRNGKRNQVFVQNITALQDIISSDVFFFDKTGTLTRGELSVSGVYPAEGKTEEELLSLLITVEKDVNGPFAQAVQSYMESHPVLPKDISSFEVVPGIGVRAQIEGNLVLAGALHWLQEEGVKNLPSVKELPAQAIIGVSNGSEFMGYVTLGDQLRPQLRKVISFLQKEGKEIVLVSGDNEGSVAAVAKEAGIEKFNFEVLPKTKAEIISNLRTLGKKVAMVGDGFNDIIALLRSDGGVVFSSHKNVYNNWVDILIKRADLYPLIYLFKIEKELRKLVLENFVLAIILHALLAGIFVFRLPLEVSWQWPLGGSLLVIVILFLNSMRMLRIK